MAFDLFGATRTSQHCSLVLSFQNSLQLSGFPPEVCERWIILCDSGFLDDLVIKPQVFLMPVIIGLVFEKRQILKGYIKIYYLMYNGYGIVRLRI